jgi:16S rRNA (cytosine1402-N4)-methyltransferase
MVHIPVLVEAVLEAAAGVTATPEPGQRLWGIDGTAGAGGHAGALLEAEPELDLLCTDQDDVMLGICAENLAPWGSRVATRRQRISELDDFLTEGEAPFDGQPAWMLFDLGVASLHLDEAERGFSFLADAELDMRMDCRREITAADIVNTWSEEDLANLFYAEGGERRSRAAAAAIVAARRRTPIRRTLLLADLVERAVGKSGKIHGATRVFQALRREVNREGTELEAALALGAKHLAPGGVLCLICFHSGEARVVKHWLQDEARAARFELLWKRPRRATELERRSNPRARSAEVRAARKLPLAEGGSL